MTDKKDFFCHSIFQGENMGGEKQAEAKAMWRRERKSESPAKSDWASLSSQKGYRFLAPQEEMMFGSTSILLVIVHAQTHNHMLTQKHSLFLPYTRHNP